MTSSRTVSRLSRILALIPYVLDREVVDVNEIMERFGYTEEQLTKDLNTIFVCGLPGYGPGDLMEAYIDEDDVVIDAADFFSKAPRLTPSEALGLLAAGMTVLGSGEGSPALESAVEKLSKVVMPDADTSLTVDVLDETQNVGVLRDAAADGRVVRMVYRSVGKEETTERDVEPWSVFTSSASGFMRSSSARPIRPRVASVSGQCRVSTSARSSSSSTATRSAGISVAPGRAATCTSMSKARAMAATPCPSVP